MNVFEFMFYFTVNISMLRMTLPVTTKKSQGMFVFTMFCSAVKIILKIIFERIYQGRIYHL